MNNIDFKSIATLRLLAIDMINKAKSGHPGMALGSAPILYSLFKDHIVADPYDPSWVNRDRFVLSAGHASSLLYALLHLSDYAISMDDLKSFRQINSLTPGHPEYMHTPGIDATSGPLGQGIAQACGMALAESILNNKLSNKDYIDHYTYCLCGDGCLEEGLSQESITFAGLNKLNKLILLYDRNDVTLDGPLSNSSNEDIKLRFVASSWNVIEVKDGNDVDAISQAIAEAKESNDKPSLIIVNTIIGYGSLNQGTSKVHGAPLGSDDIKQLKEKLDFPNEEFFVSDEVRENFKESFIKRGKKAHVKWLIKTEDFKNEKGNESIEFIFKNDVSSFLKHSDKKEFDAEKVIATRKASQNALNYYNKLIPNLCGGSADVAGSTLTDLEGQEKYSPENRSALGINFGIREFLMASVCNGILLHGGLRSYCGSFLVFSDYMKSAIRMSALSKLPVIYVFTHDSISVGEDGPTHEPIEHLAMLRSIPNVNVIRPCDERETFGAYKEALLSLDHPTCVILTRHTLPLISTSSLEGVKNGAYIVRKEEKNLDFTLIATGSEVSLALNAAKLLKEQGIDVRVVSMPSMFNFEKTSTSYQESILGKDYEKRIFVEMASSYGLHKYAKHTMSINEFGRSAPFNDILNEFGYTAENLAKTVKNLVK